MRSVDLGRVWETGHRALLCSAAHLTITPGVSVIKRAGGVARFMGWPGTIASDSGGYQVFSLSRSNNLASVDDSGMRFRFSSKHKFRTLTPESTVELQLAMGSTFLYCLDYCTSPTAPRAEQERSVALTIDWARRSRTAFDKAMADVPPEERPELFCVVQGGSFPDLRRRCAEELVALGFTGFGFGGYPIEGGRLVDSFFEMVSLVPAGSRLHGLGVGAPEHVGSGWAAGYTIFDCTLPTRNARRGVLYTNLTIGPEPGAVAYKVARLTDESWVRRFEPIDPDCDCRTCATHSGAYLHHLLAVEDDAASSLLSVHNLRFYARLMERLAAC